MFSQAIGLGAEQSNIKQGVKSTLTEKAGDVKEFGHDTMEDIKKKLEDASGIFSKGNFLAGLATTVLGLALGAVNPFLGAAVMGGARYGFGKMAEAKANEALGKGVTSKWGKGSRRDMSSQFTKATNKASIMTAAMAGASAYAANKGMGPQAEKLDVGGNVTAKATTGVDPASQITDTDLSFWDAATNKTGKWDFWGEGGWVDKQFTGNLNPKDWHLFGGKDAQGMISPIQYGKAAISGFKGTTGLLSGGVKAGSTIWDIYNSYSDDDK